MNLAALSQIYDKNSFSPFKSATRGAALFHGMGCEHKPPFVTNVHPWCVHMDIPHQEKDGGDKLEK